MTVLVASQAYIFLWTVAGGIAVAFLYDLFRIRRKAIKAGNFFTYLEDLFFWLLVAIIIFSVVYFSNDGEIRGYVFIGALLGVVLYMLLLSKIIMKIALFIIKIIREFLKLIWFVTTYPFRLILRLLSIPVRFAAVNVGKSTGFVRRACRNRFSVSRVWHRMFKNIRKKI